MIVYIMLVLNNITIIIRCKKATECINEVIIKMLKELAQEIVKSISEIIGYNILITDERAVIIGCSDEIVRVGTLHEASLDVIKTGKPKFHNVQEAERLGVKPGYTATIQLAGKVVGTVGIAGEPKDVTKFILIVKKQVEILMHQEVLLKSSLVRERALQNLIQEISFFDPAVDDEGLLLTRGQELGYNLNCTYIAIVIDIYQFSNISQKIHEDALNGDSPEMIIQWIKIRVNNVIKNTFTFSDDICTPMANDKYVILHAIIKKRPVIDILTQVKRKCSELEVKLKELGIRTTMGIGSVAHNLLEVRNSYRDAWKALTIGKKLNGLPMIFCINDLYLEDLISSININVYNKFISNVLQNLQNHSDWDELIRTICTWCESGFSLIGTANKLRIHKNTLIYRLTKIEQISGYNLRNFRDSITLYIAVMANILNSENQKKDY